MLSQSFPHVRSKAVCVVSIEREPSICIENELFQCSSPHYYKLKMRVSMMHYNSLMLDDILGRRKEIGNTMITRKGRIVIAIKRKRSPGTHTWREEVRNMIKSIIRKI